MLVSDKLFKLVSDIRENSLPFAENLPSKLVCAIADEVFGAEFFSIDEAWAGDKKALSEDVLESIFEARNTMQETIRAILWKQTDEALEAFAGPMENDTILEYAHTKHFYRYVAAKAHLTVARHYHVKRSQEIEAAGGSGAYCVFHSSDLRECAEKHGFDESDGGAVKEGIGGG